MCPWITQRRRSRRGPCASSFIFLDESVTLVTQFSLDRLVALYLQQRQRDKEMVAALLAAENDVTMRVTLPV